MSDSVPRFDVDFDRLEAHLRVLGFANRLRLLALLRTPRTLDEIRLAPSPAQAGERPERPISRQGVQNHLDQLIAAGLIRARPARRADKRAVHEYVLDHARLFAVLEDLRHVAALEPSIELDPFRTEGLAAGPELLWEDGPKLVLVRGAREGEVSTLRAKDAQPPRGWVVGRAAHATVRLDYDPYVSLENAEILRTADGFRLLDLRTARNGTFLNWRRLPVGAQVPLRSGDVIGVGRSLLVFRDD